MRSAASRGGADSAARHLCLSSDMIMIIKLAGASYMGGGQARCCTLRCSISIALALGSRCDAAAVAMAGVSTPIGLSVH